jgi:hypothetical protein
VVLARCFVQSDHSVGLAGRGAVCSTTVAVVLARLAVVVATLSVQAAGMCMRRKTYKQKQRS